MKTLFAIGALLAAPPADPEAPLPDRPEVEAAAERCGLPARFLRTGTDAHGDFAEIQPDGDGNLPDAKAFLCLLAWAKRTGARIGFISEPPPGPAGGQKARMNSYEGTKAQRCPAGDDVKRSP